MALNDLAIYTLGLLALNYLVVYRKNKLVSGILFMVIGVLPLIIQNSAGVTQFDRDVGAVFAFITIAIGATVIIYEFMPTLGE